MENIIMIGDFLKDLDDEHSLVGAAALHQNGLIDLKCVVGNLAPALLRARGAKGTLEMLGLPNILVGVGTPVFQGQTYPYEANVPYLAPADSVIAFGEELLIAGLYDCKDESVTLVLQSGLTDAALLLRNATKLFVRKVKRVVIMGGVETDGKQVVLNNRGHLVPNNANNNSFDMKSAIWLHEKLQELGIPMTIVTREVAYAAQVPFSMYDELEATGNPIGKCLRDRQKPSMQHLWEAACSPPGSTIRGTLPNDRDRNWFVNVFCDGIDPGESANDDIWPYVGRFNLYDPTALYAAVPELLEQFYFPTEVIVEGVKHLIIGVSPANHGVKNIKALTRFMVENEVDGLRMANH